MVACRIMSDLVALRISAPLKDSGFFRPLEFQFVCAILGGPLRSPLPPRHHPRSFLPEVSNHQTQTAILYRSFQTLSKQPTMADVDMSLYSDDDFSIASDGDDGSDFEFVENVAPKKKPTAKAAKAAPKAAKGGKKAAPSSKSKGGKGKKATAALDSLTNLDDSDDDMSITDAAAAPAKKSSTGASAKEKTIEQMYQKKTQLEHILLRPDTYIGSTEPTTQSMFVLNADSGRIINKTITYTPGLYKIFDEILVNAADNKQRDPGMDRMDVTIDAEANTISVQNNGKGIPVEMHKEHKVS